MKYNSTIFYISFVILFLICLIIFIVFSCKPTNNHISVVHEDPIQSLQISEYFDNEIDNNESNCYQLIKNKNNLIIGSKPKVLIISCYGYGNIGDNMYSEVFTKFLPECEIMKISDHSVFVDINKKILRKPPSNNYPFDYLIIGGGGLITAKKLKDSLNIPYYLDIAKKKNKAFFIVSCGVQGSVNNFTSDFSIWKDALNYASVITVRSKKDKELLGTIVNPNKIHYFRDLGYIFPHTLRIHKNSIKTTTLIVAGPVHDKNQIIKNYINRTKNDVVIMNMGSLKDDDNNRRMIKMNFPDVNIIKYYGAGKSPEFTIYDSFMVNQDEMEHILKINPDIVGINPSDLTLDKVVNVIYNSEIVFTGRYHGFVFSRSLGIKYDTLGMDTNKMLWEEPATTIEDMVLNSYNHIRLLRKNMGLVDNSMLDISILKNSISGL